MSANAGKKRVTGGSAAARGLDFQGRVSAIVMANLLTERPMGWLDGVLDDTPLQLNAETGGPGDDIGIVTTKNVNIEVQVKRGLQRGQDLWDALLSLAEAICGGKVAAGVLVICPNSSGTIKEQLAEDIVRIGTARFDELREIGEDFLTKLRAKSISPVQACSVLRIVVVSAIDENSEAEKTASERLNRISSDIKLAWQTLCEHGNELIRIRGSASLESLSRVLAFAKVPLKLGEIETQIQLQVAVAHWLQKTYSQMTILGIAQPVEFASNWIALKAHIVESHNSEQHLEQALKKYHAYASSPRANEREIDADTFGRFVKKCVVLGGPGIGKSTLLRKLALDYSNDGFLVLHVKLPHVASILVTTGKRIEDCLLEVALSGSGLTGNLASFENAVIICDALDECGKNQSLLTTALHAFAVAHPNARMIISSRPIGYQSGQLGNWRHYELRPLNENKAKDAFAKILQAIPFTDESKRKIALACAEEQFSAGTLKGLAARSPLMLTLVAALASQGIEPDSNRAALYRQLLRLIERHPPPRLIDLPSETERKRFLELLGWSLLSHGNEQIDKIFERCAHWFSKKMGLSTIASEVRIQACCEYWEDLGVIERVRTFADDTLTFVHKTFGEFAAASYIASSSHEDQRHFIAEAIRKPDWREALSFASHLGLVQTILDVWVEMTQAGDGEAVNGLNAAMELIVESGMPIDDSAIQPFISCCWASVGKATSTSRYAAGEALCIIAKSRWDTIRTLTLQKLESDDKWSQLVAWSCLCISLESDIPYAAMLEKLKRLADLLPNDSYLASFGKRSDGTAVWQHFILGAAQRILQQRSEENGLEILNKFIARKEFFSVGTYQELIKMYADVNYKIPDMWDLQEKNRGLLFSPERWIQSLIALLDLIDDPEAIVTDNTIPSIENLELGAILHATKFWETPISDCASLLEIGSGLIERRKILYAVAQCAKINLSDLITQARLVRAEIIKTNECHAFYRTPAVDVIPDFDIVPIKTIAIHTLEKAILEDGEFFASNATRLLASFKNHTFFASQIERVLSLGYGDSLRFGVILCKLLPIEVGQRLIMYRLENARLITGCNYLYDYVTIASAINHEEIIYRGLQNAQPEIAIAAAKLASRLPLTQSMAQKLLMYFDQWKEKEEPYPVAGGIVPSTPRDEIAKMLAVAFKDDYTLLISFATDTRPDIRSAAKAPILAAVTTSADLRQKLLDAATTNGALSELMRQSITLGAFTASEVPSITLMLHSPSAKIRYGALPILGTKYLSKEQICAHARQLLSDPEMDIREEVACILQKF